MKKLCLILLLALPALAGSPAQLARPTDLKAKPFNDAETLAKLDAKTMVTVLLRQGAWAQVQLAQQPANGWLRMLNLRASSDAGFDSAGVGKVMAHYLTGSTDSTATTGVKGLSEASLRDASPNPQEFSKLTHYSANRADADGYAKKSGLHSQTLDYLAPPSK